MPQNHSTSFAHNLISTKNKQSTEMNSPKTPSFKYVHGKIVLIFCENVLFSLLDILYLVR